MSHLLQSTDLFECYCWQNYTTISNTDLNLSYFDLSYIFLGHNDSVKRGLTVPQKAFATFESFILMMAFWPTCKIARPIQPIWQHFFALSWSALKMSSWEFKFLHIFEIPSSNRHENTVKCCKDFLSIYSLNKPTVCWFVRRGCVAFSPQYWTF